MPSYHTVARGGTAEIEVKRSRFIAHVARADTEEQARAVLERARKEHWDARHHCSAFVLGPDAATTRSSDDGEPSGTAGAPMLEVLRGRGVSDVVAVVTRYFGGVLLGAGGLVRAYSDAVRAALDSVGVLERRQLRLFEVVVEHALAGRLENDLRARSVLVRGVDYAEAATLHLGVDAGDEEELHGLLAELTGGSSALRPAGSAWVDVPPVGGGS
ncbi:MAG TPA: YigZ family protein [Nocardioidaceae bacterium]|nr:YigZ family protein [Nocardioidaceae bacterium]